MKSLKALEGKYTLIREAAIPPAVPAAPATPAAPAVPAAPAAPAVPAAPLDPKVLAALNAPDSPLQPKKIEEISKDPVKLQAFAQNELPKIIDGIVAEITKTNPDAIPEILAAAKRNDLKTVQELLAKYSKEAASTPAAAPAPAPAAAPVMSTASYIPNSSNTVTEGFGDTVKQWAKDIASWFGFSGLGFAGLGFLLAGPVAALALPLLVKALQGGSGSGNDSRNSKLRVIRVQIKKLPDSVKNALTELLTNLDPQQYNKAKNSGVLLGSLDVFDSKEITDKIKKQIANNMILSVSDDIGKGLYEIISTEAHFIVKVITAGSDLPQPIAKPLRKVNPAAGKDVTDPSAADKAATDKAAAAVDRARAKGLTTASYVPFTSLANKVLKEFHKNSEPLPIETANKK